MNNRLERVNSQIKRILSNLIANEIKDPRNSEKNMDGTVLIRYNKETKSYDYTYRENEKNTISMRIYPKKSLKYL